LKYFEKEEASALVRQVPPFLDLQLLAAYALAENPAVRTRTRRCLDAIVIEQCSERMLSHIEKGYFYIQKTANWMTFARDKYSLFLHVFFGSR
jgi:hypothetical protein